MTILQIEILKKCIQALESTLGSIPSSDADNIVREVRDVLKFLADREEAESK